MNWPDCLRHIAFLALVPLAAGLAGLWIIRATDLGYWVSLYRLECLAVAVLAVLAWMVASGIRGSRSDPAHRPRGADAATHSRG